MRARGQASELKEICRVLVGRANSRSFHSPVPLRDRIPAGMTNLTRVSAQAGYASEILPASRAGPKCL